MPIVLKSSSPASLMGSLFNSHDKKQHRHESHPKKQQLPHERSDLLPALPERIDLSDLRPARAEFRPKQLKAAEGQQHVLAGRALMRKKLFAEAIREFQAAQGNSAVDFRLLDQLICQCLSAISSSPRDPLRFQS
jgi:hypothetical protein